MVRVNLHNLLKVRQRIVVTVRRKHLGFLNLVHESRVTVSVSYDHTRFIRQSIGDNHVIDLLKEDLFGELDVRLVFFGQEFLNFSFPFAVVRHLEVSFSDVDDVLHK